MKSLILFFILVTAVTGKANAADFNSIECSEFEFTDILSINVDLETSRYVVRDSGHFGGAQNQILGRGRIGRRPKIEGRYIIFSLYENSKLVGFLRATDAGRDTPPSELDYKGYSASDDFNCRFVSR